MAPIGKLYGPKHGMQIKRILAIANYGGLELELPEYTHMEDNKKPEFLAKFPFGKIPAFEGSDGFLLFESTAVANYVASLAPNSGLLGHDDKSRAEVDKWTSLAEKEILSKAYLAYQMCSGQITPYTKPIHVTLVEQHNRGMDVLEKHLEANTFLVGERLTAADFALAAITQLDCKLHLDAAARAKYPAVVRHMETVINHPKVGGAFGETEYAEKAVAYVPPPKEKKEPKPAAEAKPKAEKKKKEVEEEEDDDIDLVPKEEPKAKNPLDSLPKSTFNLEDWKRAYSNKETRGAGGAIEWFYQNFDKEGFSIWRCDFKYNNELTQTFMSSNQIGGFFNRLEASRKYLFGSMGVLGKANDSIITGVLILRGPDCKPVVEVAPDWESYEYAPIDITDEKQKAFFEGALAWDLEIDGKAWVDGKNFK